MMGRSRSQRFLLVFVVWALALFAALLAPPLRPPVEAFSGRLAFAAGWVIRLLGGICIQHGAVLSNPVHEFAMEVRDGCNGINVVILLWAAMLGYPSSRKWKLIGLGGGLAAIQGLNMLRLITLFYLGQYNRPLFLFAHLYLWEMLIIIDAMAVFALWVRRAEAA